MKAGKRMFELYTTEDAANMYTYTGSIPLTEAAPGS
jgi:hypothetical protein